MNLANQPRRVSGRDSIKEARQLEVWKDKQRQWPYTWLFPVESADEVFLANSIPAPAVATLDEIRRACETHDRGRIQS